MIWTDFRNDVRWMSRSNRNAVNFYENIGFTLLESKENQTNQNPLMFLDLNKIDWLNVAIV